MDGSSFSGQPSGAFSGAKAQEKGSPSPPFLNAFILSRERLRLRRFGTLSFAFALLMESNHRFFFSFR